MKRIYAGLMACALACVAIPARATMQVGDSLLMGGERHGIIEEPLEMYLARGHKRPTSIMVSSSCSKRYAATWEIVAGRLYLAGISECEIPVDTWNTAFDGEPSPKLADWYTGVLRMPRGRPLNCPMIAYANMSERDFYLLLVDGRVVNGFTVENDALVAGYCDSSEGDAFVGPPSFMTRRMLGDWCDATLFRHAEDSFRGSCAPFRVRGFWFGNELFVPGDGGVSPRSLRLHEGSDAFNVPPATPVEATLVYGDAWMPDLRPLRLRGEVDFDLSDSMLAQPNYRYDPHRRLVVQAVRVLEPGEPLDHGARLAATPPNATLFAGERCGPAAYAVSLDGWSATPSEGVNGVEIELRTPDGASATVLPAPDIAMPIAAECDWQLPGGSYLVSVEKTSALLVTSGSDQTVRSLIGAGVYDASFPSIPQHPPASLFEDDAEKKILYELAEPLLDRKAKAARVRKQAEKFAPSPLPTRPQVIGILTYDEAFYRTEIEPLLAHPFE